MKKSMEEEANALAMKKSCCRRWKATCRNQMLQFCHWCWCWSNRHSLSPTVRVGGHLICTYFQQLNFVVPRMFHEEESDKRLVSYRHYFWTDFYEPILCVFTRAYTSIPCMSAVCDAIIRFNNHFEKTFVLDSCFWLIQLIFRFLLSWLLMFSDERQMLIDSNEVHENRF